MSGQQIFFYKLEKVSLKSNDYHTPKNYYYFGGVHMNNQITIVGRISSEFTYDHETYGEKYYRVIVSVKRDSGIEDNIPVIISDRIINTNDDYFNKYVAIKGQFRSYNLRENLKTRLILFVFATSIEVVAFDNINDLFLEGVITKPPTYRFTLYGREISDIILAVNRGYGKCDYIPCIVWGRSANYVSGLMVGDTVRVAGRVQSREYDKNGETKTAYEVSVNLVESV